MERNGMLTIAFLTALLAGLVGCPAEPDNPLAAAAAKGDTQAVKTLLSEGADPNTANGFTALSLAARAGHTDIMKILLAAGADPNLRSGGNNWTPLMHAIHKGQKEAVLTLLDAGADVDATTKRGRTALMMAAGYGYTEIVQVLLDHGADPYSEDTHGDNALTMAVGGVPDIDRFTVGHCQTPTVKALLAKAPDLKLKDNFFGRFARLSAKWGRCSEVLRLIEQQR